MGDADGNGSLNRYDAALILKYCVGRGTISAANLNRANANGDAVLDPADAAWVLKAVG